VGDFSEDKDSKLFFGVVSLAVSEMLDLVDNFLKGLFLPIFFVF
jgi:hypothetical protein